MIWRFSRCGFKLNWKDVSLFQSTCDDSEFSFHAATKQENFFGNQFLPLIHPEIILEEFNLTTCKETEKQSLKQKGRRLFTQVKTDKIKAQFQCRHLHQGRWQRGLQYWWIYRRTTWSESKDCKYRNCNSTNSLIHNRSWRGKFDSKTQVTTCSDFPSDAMLWIK